MGQALSMSFASSPRLRCAIRFLLPAAAALCVATTHLSAQSATLTANASTYATGGGQVTLTATIDYSTVAAPTALGYTINLPSGWALVSTGGANPPNVAPQAGSTGALEYAYATSFPPNVATFSVVVSYPASLSGAQLITASAFYRSPLATLTIPSLTFGPASGGPAITTQPATQTTTVGQAVTFSVAASGTPAPTFQWRKGGAAITGATSASFSIASAQASDAGNYDVVVTNSAGSVTSATATLTVTSPATPPAITAAPTSQSVLAGANATFSVTATGTAPLSYQWRKGGVAIGGATSATLAITNAQAADAGNYDVVVSNGAGSVTSPGATLTVSSAAVAPTISVQPTGLSVGVGGTVSFSVTASGSPSPSYQWRKNGSAITGGTNATFTLGGVQTSDAGSYDVVVSNSAGSVTSSTAVLTVSTAASAPVISTQPAASSVAAGAGASFSVGASGVPSPTYQWRKNGVAISGATGATFSIAAAQPGDAASYDVVVTNSAGSATSSAAALTVLSSRLVNASVRSTAGSGEQTLIVGFSIRGTGTRQLLLRGIGPSLAQFGVTGTLADPRLRLFNADGVIVMENDDWGGVASLSAAFAAAGAFALAPATKDSALLVPLPPGNYTAHVTSPGGSGIALVETYDADAGPPSTRIANMSVRTQVGTGDGVLVVGFVIAGNASKNLLVRAVGPGLVQFGVTGAVADPQLQLFQGTTLIGGNDNWGDGADAATIAATAAATGAFALAPGSKDAALLRNLTPGAYTVQVTAANNGTGTVLVEVYEVP